MLETTPQQQDRNDARGGGGGIGLRRMHAQSSFPSPAKRMGSGRSAGPWDSRKQPLNDRACRRPEHVAPPPPTMKKTAFLNCTIIFVGKATLVLPCLCTASSKATHHGGSEFSYSPLQSCRIHNNDRSRSQLLTSSVCQAVTCVVGDNRSVAPQLQVVKKRQW
ncbi:unnamed protein product, partial [Musa acuminata subsp. burmannicoides]